MKARRLWSERIVCWSLSYASAILSKLASESGRGGEPAVVQLGKDRGVDPLGVAERIDLGLAEDVASDVVSEGPIALELRLVEELVGG